jgi:sugar phosphate isomerase/epimerase
MTWAGDRLRLAIAASTHPAQFEAIAYKGELEATIAEIAALGFDGVELAIRDPALVDADGLTAMIARQGLAVPAIGTGQAYAAEGLCLTSASADVRRAAVARLVSHLPLAAHFDAVVIVGLIGTSTLDGQSVEEATDHLVAGLHEVCGRAREHGVRLVLEPCNRYESALVRTVEDALEVVARAEAPNLGLLVDTFHMNIEEPSPPESIREAGARIFHVHAADSNRWHPGAGHLDFAALIEELRATGYRGFVSGEFLPLPDARTAGERFVAHMRALEREPVGGGA